MTRRQVFWSGGFDSTALVLEHLRAGHHVVPFVIDMDPGDGPEWQKTRNERDARERIRANLPTELQRHLDQEQLVTTDHLVTRHYRLEYELWERQIGHWQPGADPTRNRQLPMLVLAAGEIGGRVDAGFVATDRALRDQAHQEVLANAVDVPMGQWTKFDIWLRAVRYGYAARLRQTWSCEGLNDQGRIACGVCEACQHRVLR